MKRRTFLKLAGLGSISFVGCSQDAEKKLFSLLHAPEDTVTGKAKWYAATCRECPAGCGILAKNREGRIIKIEGNPLHPINSGKLCIRGQAALQGLYHPDRIQTPLIKKDNAWQAISFDKARALVLEKAQKAAASGPNRVKMMTAVAGDSLLDVFQTCLEKWHSNNLLIFEPFAYDALKKANDMVFGVDGLVSYDIEASDLLISFGADFLETWLSPVAYAGQFKKMHARTDRKKGFFFHISPYRSLTGANADKWISCNPGSEAVIALGLMREMLLQKESPRHSKTVLAKIRKICAPYTREIVTKLSGIAAEDYAALVFRVTAAKAPLVLGTGTATPGPYNLQTNMAVNFLNYLLDPRLKRLNFKRRHRVETAAPSSEINNFITSLSNESAQMLLIHNCNPAYAMAGSKQFSGALKQERLFTVCFSNILDETAELADLVFPVKHPLETWDEYGGLSDLVSLNQPTMGSLTQAPDIGDLFLNMIREADKADGITTNDKTTPPIPAGTDKMMAYLAFRFQKKGLVNDRVQWVKAVQAGGIFTMGDETAETGSVGFSKACEDLLSGFEYYPPSGYVFAAMPSIRFFDGRGANKSWLCEIPDPLTKIAWQTPVLMHPKTAKAQGLRTGEVVAMEKGAQEIRAAVYETEDAREGVFVMSTGQGHTAYGRYAKNTGENPFKLLSFDADVRVDSYRFDVEGINIRSLRRREVFAHTDGAKDTKGRKIALSQWVHGREPHADVPGKEAKGLAMHEFPLTLPLAEGYDKKRDFYSPHAHDTYRWSMVIDLDRCIGCGACSAACYAENNLSVVGLEQVRNGREMAWMSIERYTDGNKKENYIFLPMLCQHCDNAPCESVCPVYAPHHSKEGLNNQVYNRCIGTRFCSQNCPYKVRRFNWFDGKWADSEKLQLNPEVTVRSKGVMEKCSFCVQRIKDAHGVAKDENRKILDGEVVPACVQTCPTNALSFGNLMDPDSRVRQLVKGPRAYQVMGYLNTKPAVIYLKKKVWEI